MSFEALQAMKQDVSILSGVVLDQLIKGRAKNRRFTDVLLTIRTNLNDMETRIQNKLELMWKQVEDLKSAEENKRGFTLEDSVPEYSEQLVHFHEETLQRLTSQQPIRHDVSKYVQLSISMEDVRYQDCDGLNEYLITAKRHHGQLIKPENLFIARPRVKEDDPRTVILVGVPGSGKTITSYHLLQSTIHKQLFQNHSKFTFFIKFRDINEYNCKLSFRSLLISHHGPSIMDTDQEELWSFMVKHQKKVMFILDGYDECEGLGANFSSQNTVAFTNLVEDHKPQVLLHNLICGNIWKHSKVLLTTRPHCVHRLKAHALNMRLVNIEALDESSLYTMVQNHLAELPILCSSVLDYLRDNTVLRSLCSVPVHAKGFLDYVTWVHQDTGDTPLLQEKMPQSMSALLFVLDLKMLQSTDRDMDKADSSMASPEEILAKSRSLMQNLAKLASTGTLGKLKQLFSQQEIENCGLTVRDVEKSIMTCSVVSVKGFLGPESKRFFGFTHFTQQEHLTGLYLTQVCTCYAYCAYLYI